MTGNNTSEFLMTLFFYFMTCSFFGWIIESVYKSIMEKRWVNSGFLSGPFVPIYGFGAFLIYLLSIHLAGLPLWGLFLIAVFIPSILEYFVSFLLEKIFSIKLWNYAHEKINLNGRICLKFSLIWSGLTLFTILCVQPFFINWFSAWKDSTRDFMAGMAVMYLIGDIYTSGRVYYHYAAVLQKIRDSITLPKFVLQIGNMTGNRIPIELRKFLRPLRSFSYLRQEVQANIHVFPGQFMDLLKRTIDPFFNNETKNK